MATTLEQQERVHLQVGLLLEKKYKLLLDILLEQATEKFKETHKEEIENALKDLS